MRVERVENDIVYYKCKNCGKEEIKNVAEIEKRDN